MAKLTRRGFIAASVAAGGLRSAGIIVAKPATRRILTLVYDKSLGMMRAVERVVPR
ncbi:Tat pathway signal protein [Sulfitobacter sp. S190]|uniref:Tat pathway signal protein n=1 Tax=Sulfitobacter sp. S190 TaxID=2867022 RepID=UPI0021A68C12|nr:Tat pathway signal protein [Sulfitobacter sp. S190]UWR23474.1 Tat pathway signal protein [Sulfitobacter sp. S190]